VNWIHPSPQVYLNLRRREWVMKTCGQSKMILSFRNQGCSRALQFTHLLTVKTTAKCLRRNFSSRKFNYIVWSKVKQCFLSGEDGEDNQVCNRFLEVNRRGGGKPTDWKKTKTKKATEDRPRSSTWRGALLWREISAANRKETQGIQLTIEAEVLLPS
jgi:hypothetical protein